MIYRRWLFSPESYRVQRKFIQRPHIEKKVRSEDYKRRMEWREYKKVRKDKSRHGWSSCMTNAGYSKRPYQARGHRKMRAFIRGRISQGDYSLERGWRKSFINPWDWGW